MGRWTGAAYPRSRSNPPTDTPAFLVEGRVIMTGSAVQQEPYPRPPPSLPQPRYPPRESDDLSTTGETRSRRKDSWTRGCRSAIPESPTGPVQRSQQRKELAQQSLVDPPPWAFRVSPCLRAGRLMIVKVAKGWVLPGREKAQRSRAVPQP